MQYKYYGISVLLLLVGLLPCTLSAQTSAGRDFWVMFIENKSGQNQDVLFLQASASSACTVTVTHPATNWTVSKSLASYTTDTIILPNSIAIPNTIGAAANNAFHVTATDDISLYAYYRDLASAGVTMVIPTQYLDTQYMAQTWPGDATRSNVSGAELGFLAIQDSTVITRPGMTQIVLNAGQSFVLTTPAPHSFSGLMVHGSKPFAMFQGNSLAGIPAGSPSGDLIFEQAIPTRYWGTEYVIVSNGNRQQGAKALITSLENNCHVTGDVNLTLSAGGTAEIDVPYNCVRVLTSDKPICVGYYHLSSDYYGPIGDASQMMLPPMDRGVKRAIVKGFMTSRISSTYLNIVTQAGNANNISMNGSNIGGQFTTSGGYSYARIGIANQGGNTREIVSTGSPFVAWVYGVGQVEDYCYSVGMTFSHIVCDTVPLSDTVCQGHPYQGNGFDINATQLSTPGTDTFYHRTQYDTTCVVHQLALTVLPTVYRYLTDSISEGDTLHWYGRPLTQPGTYRQTLTAASGCDSIEILTLGFRTGCDTISLSDIVCQGHPYRGNGFNIDSSRLDRAGTQLFYRMDSSSSRCIVFALSLTVLPNVSRDITDSILIGDTLYWNRIPLTQPGDYTHTFTAANGCDSTVTLHLYFKKPLLIVYPTEICVGDTVTLTAVNVSHPQWASNPEDSRLATQQGMGTLRVIPQVPTVYYLLAADGSVIDSAIVDVQHPYPCCISYTPAVINESNPSVHLNNCDTHPHTSLWRFGDNLSEQGNNVVHEFQVGNEDSLWITLTSCTSYGCCSDTTVWLPVVKSSPVWFPNIFTPGKETNNTFGPRYVALLDYELWIFNRWGECIFHTTDPEEAWDGTYRGQMCEQSAYTYLCRYSVIKNEKQQAFGAVTLLK